MWASRFGILFVILVENDVVGDNEVKLGAVYRSPGIYLTAEENPRKLQLADHLMKAEEPVTTLNAVPYLQMTSVGS